MTAGDLKVHLAINDNVVLDRDLGQDLSVTPDNLGNDLERQASLYAFWAMRCQESETLLERYEFERERTEAQVAIRLRDEALNHGAKITDRQLELAVSNDPEVQEIRLTCLEAKHATRMLKTATRSLEHKREMLSNMAYQRQAELRTLGASRSAMSLREDMPPLPTDRDS